jgi:hypothetical protein
MLIIGTVLDDPAARLQAGQAAQRVVLTAATEGVPVRSVFGQKHPPEWVYLPR